MSNDSKEIIDKENKNLSHEPTQELLNILQEFKTAMVKPSEIFDRFVTKAREENFSNDEINILLSTKEIKKFIPEGSINYYKKKYDIPITNYNLSKSNRTKLENNDHTDNEKENKDIKIPPIEYNIIESSEEPKQQEENILKFKVDMDDTKELYLELTKLRQTKGFMKGFTLEINKITNRIKMI